MREFEEIDRAIEAGVGVRIAAKAHAHALEELDQRTGRVTLAAIEGHVLEEMGQPALVVALVERTSENEEAEGDAAFWFAIWQDDVTQAVRELAEARGWIGLKITPFMRKRGRLCDGCGAFRGSKRRERKRGSEEKREVYAIQNAKRFRPAVTARVSSREWRCLDNPWRRTFRKTLS